MSKRKTLPLGTLLDTNFMMINRSLSDDNQLTDDQFSAAGPDVYLAIAAPRSRLGRVVHFVADLVLGLLVVAAIAVLSVAWWENKHPRISYDITPAVVKKACGVPV